jgi:large subunit ribosomal protein L19
MNAIESIEKEYLRMDIPDFKAGDTVKVHFKIQEGEKERIQIFEGVVIRKRKGNTGATFTVRKISYGIGVERIFPLYSPFMDKIEVISRGRVRRSRLYYLRERKGKAARIREKR